MRRGPQKGNVVTAHSFLFTQASRLLVGFSVVIGGLWLAVPILASAAARKLSPAHQSAASGKQTFLSHCGVCHGMDGRGGEHAPDIATNPIVQNLSGAELERIVQNGIPSHGMPSFRMLGAGGIQNVVDYLRLLQGKQAAVAVKGNPSHGNELFFGRAGCSSCHLIQGTGGFLGADLTKYSLTHSPQEIREAIVAPNRNLSPRAQTVVVVLSDGRKLTGIARNEDNFSLQLQTPDGSFHLLMKPELRQLSHEPVSLMPSNYGFKLSPRDIDDLISFLVKAGEAAGDAPASAGGGVP
ncbi:MAG: c-type cytochrome [Terriglobia bacterium]